MMVRDGTIQGKSRTRRDVLRLGGAAILASFAGCTAVVDRLANSVLEDVNVLNQLNREVSGSVTVTDLAGDTVLDRTFDAPSTEANGESNVVAYDDVWDGTGKYRIRVKLTDIELEGTSQASETVHIGNTGEDMVGVFVGSGIESEPIAIRVGTSFSDFAEDNEGE